MDNSESQNTDRQINSDGTQDARARKLAKSGKGPREVTPEMRATAEALAHPDGDPYDSARRMGFYCEQCG